MEQLLQKHRLFSGRCQRHIKSDLPLTLLIWRCQWRHSLLPLTLPTHRLTVEHDHIPRASAPLANITGVVRI
jgi:hypothetical protein